MESNLTHVFSIKGYQYSLCGYGVLKHIHKPGVKAVASVDKMAVLAVQYDDHWEIHQKVFNSQDLIKIVVVVYHQNCGNDVVPRLLQTAGQTLDTPVNVGCSVYRFQNILSMAFSIARVQRIKHKHMVGVPHNSSP
jgi:hypothetical protein